MPTKTLNGSSKPTATPASPIAPANALSETDARILNTLRMMGARNADSSLPSEKLEKRVKIRHGPLLHALRELERKGLVGRITGRKDVFFHARG